MPFEPTSAAGWPRAGRTYCAALQATGEYFVESPRRGEALWHRGTRGGVTLALLDDFLDAMVEDPPVRAVRVGPFLTAVAGVRCGLAATNTGPTLAHGQPAVPAAGSLVGCSSRELAMLTRSSAPLERSLGFAALNSLLPEPAGCRELNAADYLVEQGRGRRVALVGHFPFVPRLREAAAQLDILELRAQPGDLAAEAAQEVIPAADVVAITGSALVNDTMDGLLALCPRQALVVVLGPTTPLAPAWFDHGVDVISGAVVEDSERVLASVGEGAIFRQLRGIRLLTLVRPYRLVVPG